MRAQLGVFFLVLGGSAAALPTVPSRMATRARLVVPDVVDSGNYDAEDKLSKAPLAASARGGSVALASTTSNTFANALLLGLVAATALAYKSFLGSAGRAATAAAASDDAKYAAGLFYSGVALLGNTGVSAVRKVLARQPGVGNAQQVGAAALVQGCGALVFCLSTGAFATPVPAAFWAAAVSSSLLNALVKTLETKAFAESDMSLCAPFLAFDPVMQVKRHPPAASTSAQEASAPSNPRCSLRRSLWWARASCPWRARGLASRATSSRPAPSQPTTSSAWPPSPQGPLPSAGRRPRSLPKQSPPRRRR